MGDINVSLREPRDNMEEKLVAALARIRLGDVTAHFTLRWWYRGMGRWTCQMSREGSLGAVRGDYIISSDRDDFIKAGLREARLHKNHRMVLAVL